MKNLFKYAALFAAFLFTLYSCEKEVTIPVIQTSAATSITSSGASGTGTITSNGGAEITDKGICWGITAGPTINGSKTQYGTGSSSFTWSISGLTPGTVYYARIYATNSAGTAYGNEISFTTEAVTATLTTTAVSSITSTGAVSGGNISSDGGSSVTARGICWATTQNPTITGSKTTDGTGAGSFISTITGLSPGITYYIRAYATNSKGTTYGQELSFRTLSTAPVVSTADITSITATTAQSGGSVSEDGGETLSAKGVCWSTNQNPTINDFKTVNAFIEILGNNPFTKENPVTPGAPGPSFVSSLSSLAPGTTYYVRAYATNSIGTSYGPQKSFTTLVTVPEVTTSAISSITSTTAAGGGNITGTGGAPISARGICWSTSQNPTTTNSKTIDGAGNGSFTSAITGLAPGTTYFVRAYATNSVGTSYGAQVSFTTLAVVPQLTTVAISDATSTSALSGGNITSDGGASITAKGVCWSTSQNPTISNSKTTDGTGSASYTSTITGLSPGTTYYVRAYATNSVGTAYGNQLTLNTGATAPTVTTASITGIATNEATGGGNVTSDGGGNVTARGVCWSTSSNPTISNSKTTDGTGTGSFTSSITGLSPGTTYYVRAYATNSVGTSYGGQMIFVTTSGVPTLTTNSISSITSTTATGGGNITSDGGNSVTARGVCWSTSQNPTISNSKTTDGTGTGSFTSSLSGLSPATTYYVRAYATNSGGTVYGNQVTFSTAAVPPSISTSSVGSITSSTIRTGGNVTSDGGSTVTARGVCWSTSPNPTISNSKTSNGTGTGTFTSYVTGLTPGTTYYLRAYATNAGGTSYGTQQSFSTAAASAYYEDGEYVVAQTNTLGSQPCEILIVGDGYQSTDFATGGLFDQNANEAINAFFAVEPYITYRNYFKVYKMASFSEDSGVTQTDQSIYKNTVFNTQFTGGSSIDVNETYVNNYAQTLPGMDYSRLRNLLIIVIINQNRYAGTCFMWSDGKAIALCPVSRQGGSNTQFAAIVNHEAGGHGWARLADEYINYTGQTISTTMANQLNTWSGYGFYPNADLTNNLSTIKWAHFVGLTGYDRVGAFEGAYYYTYGVWRPENTSCMINNIPYYNAPSRESAVKKIMSVSGGTYSLANFIANDTQKAPAAILLTKSYNPDIFVPLAPPVMKK